jgi:two-component system chemotaxis response regulator CheY
MKKLMIADDSNIVRSKIARALGQHGLDIVGLASNGREALELFKTARPEVVTMDLTMPEMDGIECIRQIHKLDPKVRILVVSALSDKATAIQALKDGAQGFLDKPFTEAELSDAIGELLEDSSNG